jgi:hypothetical protein
MLAARPQFGSSVRKSLTIRSLNLNRTEKYRKDLSIYKFKHLARIEIAVDEAEIVDEGEESPFLPYFGNV